MAPKRQAAKRGSPAPAKAARGRQASTPAKARRALLKAAPAPPTPLGEMKIDQLAKNILYDRKKEDKLLNKRMGNLIRAQKTKLNEQVRNWHAETGSDMPPDVATALSNLFLTNARGDDEDIRKVAFQKLKDSYPQIYADTMGKFHD